MHNCEICGKGINNALVGCKNHNYHKACAEKTTNIQKILGCKACSESDKIDFSKCYKCNEHLNKGIEKCYKFLGLCNVCYARDYEDEHKARCKKCFNYVKSALEKECYYCHTIFNKKDLSKSPKCDDHLFCRKCLKKPRSITGIFCAMCTGIFNRNNLGFDTKLCNLCTAKKPSEKSGNCQAHLYCSNCKDFLSSNDGSKFPSINKCNECKNAFANQRMITDNFMEGEEKAHKIEEEKQKTTIMNKNIIKCESGHDYPGNMAQEKNIISLLRNDCENCRKLFLSLDCITVCIFCNGRNSTPNKSLCKDYRNVCKSCFFPNLEVDHVRTCQRCQSNLSDLLILCNSCDILFEKPSVYQTPKCLAHYFCSSCLKTGAKNDLNKCAQCRTYFAAINKRNDARTCALCTDEPIKQLNYCSNHGYCERCYNFITTRHCTEFANIDSCQGCKTSIERLEKPYPEEHKIASSYIKEYITCELNHSYLKDQVLINNFDIDKIKSCRACTKMFFALQELKVCIACKTQLTFSGKFICTEYRNVCEKCFEIVVQPKHTSSCNKCINSHRTILMQCNFCSEPEVRPNLYQVPKCNEHSFCIDCLSKKKPIAKTFCSRCVSYFNAIGKFFEAGCNVCSIYADSYDKICDKHKYCKTCFSFITSRDYSKFFNVATCNKCCAGIEGFKAAEISSRSGQIISPEYPQSMNLYSPSPPEINPYGLISTNEYNLQAYYNQPQNPYTKEPNDLYGMPPQNPQLYYPNQNPGPANYSQNPRFHANTISRNPSAYQSYPPPPPPANITYNPARPSEVPAYIPQPYLESSIPANIRQEYHPSESNSTSIHPQPSGNTYGLPEITLAQSNSLILSAHCTNCRNPKGVRGFLCNHNCCEECLAFSCSMKILRFAIEREGNPKGIDKRFRYSCPVVGCDRNIDVPTDLVVKLARKIIEGKEKVFNQNKLRENENNLNFVLGDLGMWVPYFDGIKPFIVRNYLGLGS